MTFRLRRWRPALEEKGPRSEEVDGPVGADAGSVSGSENSSGHKFLSLYVIEEHFNNASYANLDSKRRQR